MAKQALVDQIGKLKAKIASLQEQERELKQQLIDSGEEKGEGKLFRFTVSRSVRQSVDYKTMVMEKLKPTPRQLKPYIRESEVVSVRISARNGDKKK